MEENKNQPAGAPSSDTTSALFVSARKKQLEQQETERKAKEKEAQRMAAEAEVRRLENEVEERRRKAEDEARRVEAEGAEKIRQAALNAGNAALPQSGVPNTPSAAGNSANPLANKRLLAIVGVGGAALVVLVVLVVVIIGALSGEESEKPVSGGDASVYTLSDWYYLNGDPTSDGLCFAADGTVQHTGAEPDSPVIMATYAIVGNRAELLVGGETFMELSIIDNDTLATGTPEEVFTRIAAGISASAAPTTAAPADTQAPEVAPEPKVGDVLNATVELVDVNQTISYPSSSLFVEENIGNGAAFSTRRDGLGAVGYIQTDVSNVNTSTDRREALLEQIGSIFLENMMSTGTDSIVLSDDAYFDENNVLLYLGEGTFVDEEGVSYKVYVRSAFWSQTNTAYVIYAVARNSHYEVCKTLAQRIKDSVKFN